jgi:hypothetical protein
MTLEQFQHLRQWHQRHWRDQPIEKQTWDGVLTLWLIGWVGCPAALLSHAPWAAAACVTLLLPLPGVYVGLRARLHRQNRLRCDWLATLR